MLTIEAPYYFIKSTPVFRDHLNPDWFYFLPGNPKLAVKDGKLDFTLYKYRHDIIDNPDSDPTRAKGAGLALFAVEIPPSNLEALQNEVASQSGRSNARLTPVIFTNAEVHALVAHTEGDTMISDLVEAHAAPIVSPHHAAFALALTAEGATFVEKAVEGGALPVGVVYEMRFLALTPSLHARVRMQYDRMYDDFSASLGFTYYVSARLDAEIASLIERDVIHIEITSFSDAPDQERQRRLVMSLVTARVQQDFFRSGLPPAQDDSTPTGPLGQLLAGAMSGSKISSASALFVLKAKYEVEKELREFELVYDSRSAVELTHTCSGYLSTITKEGPPPNIQEIDLRDPFFSTLDVQLHSVIDFMSLADLRMATVNLVFGDDRTSYIFAPTAVGPFRFEASLTHPGEDEYQYDVVYDFDTDKGKGPPQLAIGPFRSRSRVLVIDPLVHFRYRRISFVLGPLDFGRVPQIHARVRASPGEGLDDLASGEFLLNANEHEQTWRVHLPLTTAPFTILVRTDWEDPQGTPHPGDEKEVTGDTFVVLGPYRDLMSLRVVPAADWSKISQVLVEIRYKDGDDLVDRQLSFTAAGKGAPESFDIPLLDPAKRQYQWRQTMLHFDGTSDARDWATTDYAVLVVGEQKKTTADLQIVWVGSTSEVFGLRVDLWAKNASEDEQNQSLFMRAPAETQKIATLPLGPDGSLSYRFEIRRVTAGGEELVRSEDDQHATLLVVQSGSS